MRLMIGRIVLALVFVVISTAGVRAGDASQLELDLQLLTAAQSGNVAEIKDALNKGANVSAKDDAGVTALMCATLNGHKGVKLPFLVPHES